MKMAKKILGLLFLVMALSLLHSCGAKDAKKAIDAAQTAVDDAKAAGADQYAPDEYKSAEDYLTKAREQYDQRDYKPSKASALAAKDQAELAKKRAADRKAEAEKAEAAPTPGQTTEAYNVSSLSEQPLSLEEQARAALKDVHFDFDSAELSEENKQLLVENSKWLEQHPEVKLTIEGHCDERGSTEYNLALGERRAKAVRDYLVSLGVDHSRLNIVSFGESMPLLPGHNEEAWAKNRRAHFAISK